MGKTDIANSVRLNMILVVTLVTLFSLNQGSSANTGEIKAKISFLMPSQPKTTFQIGPNGPNEKIIRLNVLCSKTGFSCVWKKDGPGSILGNPYLTWIEYQLPRTISDDRKTVTIRVQVTGFGGQKTEDKLTLTLKKTSPPPPPDIQLCEGLFENNKLTTPPGDGDNAFDCYRKILKTDPKNRIALEGICTILSTYAKWINNRYMKADFEKVGSYFKRFRPVAEFLLENYPDTCEIREKIVPMEQRIEQIPLLIHAGKAPTREKALEVLETVLKADHSNPLAKRRIEDLLKNLLEIANKEYSNGNFDSAFEKYMTVIGNSDHFSTYFKTDQNIRLTAEKRIQIIRSINDGNNAIGNGDFEKAISNFIKAGKNNFFVRNRLEYVMNHLYNSGCKAYYQSEYSSARKKLEIFLAHYDELKPILFAGLGDLIPTMKMYSEISALMLDFKQSTQKGRHLKSLQLLMNVIKMDPANISARNKFFEIIEQRKNHLEKSEKTMTAELIYNSMKIQLKKYKETKDIDAKETKVHEALVDTCLVFKDNIRFSKFLGDDGDSQTVFRENTRKQLDGYLGNLKNIIRKNKKNIIAKLNPIYLRRLKKILPNLDTNSEDYTGML